METAQKQGHEAAGGLVQYVWFAIYRPGISKALLNKFNACSGSQKKLSGFKEMYVLCA